jgi:quercetin dioxygenase-like cupin family protein
MTELREVPFAVPAGGGLHFWHIDTLKSFKALTEDTGGRLVVWEDLLPNGSSPPLHVHHGTDEAWFILDGTLTFQVGESMTTAETGAFVWAPRDIPHTFRVDSAEARLIGLALPGGFDRFVRATGRPADDLVLPPPPDGPPDVARLAEAAREHGIELLGPPLG